MSVFRPYLAKERNRVTVGPSKGFDFQNVQSAIDSISDADYDNLYVVDIAPGIYSGAVVLNKSYVDLIGTPGQTILSLDSATSTAVTFAVGSAGGAQTNTLYGLWFVRLGTVDVDGGALCVGKPGSPYTSGDTNYLKHTRIVNCRSDAMAGALRLELRDEAYTAVALPWVEIENSRFYAAQYTVTLDGVAQLACRNSHFRCSGSGPDPFVSAASHSAGPKVCFESTPNQGAPADAYNIFSSCTFETLSNANLGGAGPSGNRLFAFRLQGSSPTRVPYYRLNACHISVEHTQAVTGDAAKTRVISWGGMNTEVEDNLVINGGFVSFRQGSAGLMTGSVPIIDVNSASVAGAVKVHGATVRGIDEAALLTNIYSLSNVGTAGYLEAYVFSDQAVNGTVTAAPTKP